MLTGEFLPNMPPCSMEWWHPHCSHLSHCHVLAPPCIRLCSCAVKCYWVMWLPASLVMVCKLSYTLLMPMALCHGCTLATDRAPRLSLVPLPWICFHGMSRAFPQNGHASTCLCMGSMLGRNARGAVTVTSHEQVRREEGLGLFPHSPVSAFLLLSDTPIGF